MRRVIPSDVLPPVVVHDGVDFYLLSDDSWPHAPDNTLNRAAYLLGLRDPLTGRADWRRVQTDYTYLSRDADGAWTREAVRLGKRPRGWRCNLPRARRPVEYVHCSVR